MNEEADRTIGKKRRRIRVGQRRDEIRGKREKDSG